MPIPLEKVNEWAKMSCSRWNKDRLTRKTYRDKYQNAAKKYCNTDEHKELVSKYQRGNRSVNTYPWPYCDRNFADWDESDTTDDYSLITDQSGCVIRYSTSYCAYKIFELTGTWPKRTLKERLDAKRWVQFLAEAGYNHVLSKDEKLDSGHFYVGAKSDEAERDLVVWADLGEDAGEYEAVVSTYINKRHQILTVDPRDYTWVLIR